MLQGLKLLHPRPPSCPGQSTGPRFWARDGAGLSGQGRQAAYSVRVAVSRCLLWLASPESPPPLAARPRLQPSAEAHPADSIPSSIDRWQFPSPPAIAVEPVPESRRLRIRTANPSRPRLVGLRECCVMQIKMTDGSQSHLIVPTQPLPAIPSQGLGRSIARLLGLVSRLPLFLGVALSFHQHRLVAGVLESLGKSKYSIHGPGSRMPWDQREALRCFAGVVP